MGDNYKVVLLGEGRVGKTSLVTRFIDQEFNPAQPSTVKANMYSKKKLVVDGKPMNVSIWDTAGQERFHALGPLYYREARGAVLVYDVTDADTFEKVKTWHRELRSVVGDSNSIKIVLCANKCDLDPKQRQITEEQGKAYANSVGALHFLTSAKGNINVTEAFMGLAADMLKIDSKSAATSGGGKLEESGGRKKLKLQVDQDGAGEEKPKKKECC